MSSALGVLSRCQKLLFLIILASVAQAQLLGGAGTSSGFGSTSVLPPRMSSSSFLHGIFNVQQIGPMTVRRSALLATTHEVSALKEVCAQRHQYCFLYIFVACYEA